MESLATYADCLDRFRNRDYAAAYACFDGFLGRTDVSPIQRARSRRNMADCLYEMHLAGRAPAKWQAMFQACLDSYFNDLSQVDPGDLSPAPLADLFGLVLRFVVDTTPVEDIRERVVATHARFLADGRPRLAVGDVVEVVRKTIDRERHNVARDDHAARATAVAEATLDVLGESPSFARERAATLDTLADIAYFHPRARQTDVERYALVAGYLRNALTADPHDAFAREFLRHVERLRSVTLQIKRFGHDVGNRLENIRRISSGLKALVPSHGDGHRLLLEIDQDLKSLRVLGAIINGAQPEQSDWKFIDPAELVEKMIHGRRWPATCLTVTEAAVPWEICPDFLQVALDNLFRNAVEAYGRSGRPIPAEPCRVTIDHAARTISVSDSAGGIDPKLRETIFDPYVSSKGVSLGTSGLGLTNARVAIEAQGRHCSLDLADPQPPDGAEFIIRLPTDTL
jgi:signal transduction histidine kinase